MPCDEMCHVKWNTTRKFVTSLFLSNNKRVDDRKILIFSGIFFKITDRPTSHWLTLTHQFSPKCYFMTQHEFLHFSAYSFFSVPSLRHSLDTITITITIVCVGLVKAQSHSYIAKCLTPIHFSHSQWDEAIFLLLLLLAISLFLWAHFQEHKKSLEVHKCVLFTLFLQITGHFVYFVRSKHVVSIQWHFDWKKLRT